MSDTSQNSTSSLEEGEIDDLEEGEIDEQSDNDDIHTVPRYQSQAQKFLNSIWSSANNARRQASQLYRPLVEEINPFHTNRSRQVYPNGHN